MNPKKDLLTIETLTSRDITNYLDTAEKFLEILLKVKVVFD